MDVALLSRLNRVQAGSVAIQQQLEHETATIARHTARIEVLTEEKAQLLKAVMVIDNVIQITSVNGINKIENIITDGLRRVFNDEHIGLVIEKRETAKGISYRIRVQKGDTIGDPMDSFGGGIQNVVAFLLRVIMIKRFRHVLYPALFLDEQFSNVSSEYLPNVAQLLKVLADMGFTIFAISHQSLLISAADRIYEVIPTQDGPKLRLKVIGND